jgi:uncharacterized linocin/CFP29 family protein
MTYLEREEAPFGEKLWGMIDRTVVGAARSQLAGRRLLEVQGPLGFGVRAVGRLESELGNTATFHDITATATSAPALPIPLIRAGFSLPVRDVAAAEEAGNPISLARVAIAAIAAARLEDQLIFFGNQSAGIDGLVNVPGAEKVQVGGWEQLGKPISDILAAANALDAAGLPGPYAAALAPALFNQLFRIYEQSGLTQLEHARQILAGGIAKAPALARGGVVLAAGNHFAHLVVAQDMVAAFVGPRDTDLDFVVVESVVPRIHVAQAVCVLEEAA